MAAAAAPDDENEYRAATRIFTVNFAEVLLRETEGLGACAYTILLLPSSYKDTFMNHILTRDEIAKLSIEQRLDLIDDLWESLDEQHIPLTQAQAEEIDRRLATYEVDRGEAITWEELRARIDRRRK
jgi:putative addiction module component (TIGR02574 family)